VTGLGADTLSFDGWGRLAGGSFAGQAVIYSFDAAGFRRQRISGTATSRYLLGGLFETDAAGTIALTGVSGPAGDLAHYAGPPLLSSTVSFLYYSGHGDLAADADSTGTRTAAYRYDPFGSLLQSTPTNTTTQRWTGRFDKKLDTASGLVEMGVRPYDPVLGRFLAVDPVEGGSANSYDYARQDPVKYDLDGRVQAILDVEGRAVPSSDPYWYMPACSQCGELGKELAAAAVFVAVGRVAVTTKAATILYPIAVKVLQSKPQEIASCATSFAALVEVAKAEKRKWSEIGTAGASTVSFCVRVAVWSWK